MKREQLQSLAAGSMLCPNASGETAACSASLRRRCFRQPEGCSLAQDGRSMTLRVLKRIQRLWNANEWLPFMATASATAAFTLSYCTGTYLTGHCCCSVRFGPVDDAELGSTRAYAVRTFQELQHSTRTSTRHIAATADEVLVACQRL
jgi:hypothetical protein